MAIEKNNVVVVEHDFTAPVEKVYGALKEGRLFFNCGAWPGETEIDFRPGGKYRIDFAHFGKTYGEFLKIVENKHVSFTWNSDEMEIKGTTVFLDLSPNGKGCKLKLRHEGFADLETAESHEGGWTSGLKGVDEELTKYRVHLDREFLAPVEMLYEACAGKNFFALMSPTGSDVDFRVGGRYRVTFEKGEIKGEFLEIDKNKKIVFTWESSPCGSPLTKSTKVTMEFGPFGDNGKNSYLELHHEGFTNVDQAVDHHTGWNKFVSKTYNKVCR